MSPVSEPTRPSLASRDVQGPARQYRFAATRPRRSRRGPRILLVALLLAVTAAVAFSFNPAVRAPIDQLRWYVSDRATPIVEIAAPTQPVSGVVTATIAVSDEGPAVVESVTVDSRPVTPTQVVVIDTASLPDGLHEIIAEVRDMSRQRNAARVAALLRTENSPPSVNIAFDPPAVPQGQALVIRLTASKPASLTASLDGAPLLLAVVSDTVQWGIVGIGANAKLLTHTLVLTAADRLGNSGRYTSTFGVVATAFISENIVLPPDRQGLSNSPEQTRRLDAALASLSRLPLWQGLWRVPAPGAVTAPFGEARSYNGGPLASWHGGVDLAAADGAPVGAAAAGRVVLAEKLPVQGNTVVVDHGMGVTSAYYHMSGLAVKVGDQVKIAQTVGTVGNTGLSTGPHLHWETRVLGVPVDPWPWTRRLVP